MRLFVLIFATLLLAGYDQSPAHGPAATRSRLESAVASGAATFDFAADPAFASDRMYVFGPYSTRGSVEQALGFAWPDFGKTTVVTSDSVTLVVVVGNGTVVAWYEQRRALELSWLANDAGYPRTTARFSIVRANGAAIGPMSMIVETTVSGSCGAGSWRTLYFS